MEKFEAIEAVEEQIYEQRKTVRYDIRELTVEVISNKYDDSIDEDKKDHKNFNFIYVPEYQRDFTWDIKRQSKLIESIILGLPIPLIFVAENKNSSWEIVDGSQRIRTLHSFINNKLKLTGLEKLNRMNGYNFKSLDKTRQGKFLNTALRMIVLSEETTDQVKKDMFERINRGSDLLKPMEKRKGIYIGPFNKFIYEFCSSNERFKKLTPVDKWLKNRQEREELLLRFFGLSENHEYRKGLKDGITKYLDDFLEKKNKEISRLDSANQKRKLDKYEKKINSVMEFVELYFPYGFRISRNPQTKRSVFEAISVGVHVFLESGYPLKNSITKEYIEKKLSDQKFRSFAYVANELHKQKKLRGRIEYIVEILKA